MDFTKPPNSAPSASSGTRSPPSVSTAMPSRPIRLAAIAPSTRCMRPDSTSLNMPHLSPRDLGQPALQRHHLRTDARGDGLELGADVGIAGIARQDVCVDLPGLVDQAL